MKKTISKSLVTLIVLFLTVFSSSGASVPLEWNVNPADYRYDMSLYFNVAFATNEKPVDLTSYEVASFVGDECRGVAESISGVENCLYMRIRSNTERGETVSFKIKDKQTGEITDIEGQSITFEANKAVGLPSAPHDIPIVKYFDVNVTAASGGSVNISNGRYPEGAQVEITATPDSYYRFVGWSDGETAATRTIIVNSDITLEAYFEVEKYTLKYVLDGEEYSSYELEYGATITPETAPVKEGYTFSGWEGLPATMPASDVTVTGTFTINTYSLTYVVDGEVYKTVEYSYGATVEAEAVPVKEGFTFSGWDGLPSTMPASDVTVNGSFTANTYTLTYEVDGEVYKTVEYSYGATVEAEAAPEKEGYTFSGWEGLPTTMPASDVTVKGSFTLNSYTLTYMLDGEVYKTVDYSYGATVEAEAAPVKEGFTFSGWDGLPSTMPASDVTVNGSFTANTYALTYEVDGAVYKTVEYSYGATVEAESAPEKEGYTFSGWEGLPTTMPASDVTVKGSFTINSYTLTYMVDGEVYKTVEYSYGATVEAEAAPVKEGFTFSGWDGLPSTMPASDVTVNGSFTANTYTLTYEVDGAVYKTVEYSYGATVEAESAPEKKGYTFSGWEGLPTTMPASDMTVKGSFTINSYTLTYVVDGEVYKTVEIEFGAKITPEAAPEKEGFTFSGWKDLPEIMPASDVTVNGSFTTNSYTLTYMVDGEVYKTFQFGFGEKLTAEAAPEKEGYTFSGWEGLPETMPASDVTVTGKFTVNTYTLTYVVDGEVYKTVDIEFGTKITPEAAPVKEGFTFSGWKDLPEIMPASDVTVNGSFTTNSYTLTYVVDGEVYKTFQFGFGEKLTAESAPEKEGYSFSGWEGLPETMPASDVTVTGTFTVNTYTLTYVVDGEVYKTVDIEFGSKITPEAAPVKEGYTFSGWKDLPEIMPASDVTVNGSFSTNSYTLTYMVDGEVYKTFQFGFGEKLTAEAAPEKEGYTFSGWEGLPETMPASDVTVNGSFTVNTYTLTYVVDGEVYKTVEIEYGTKITPEAAPEKEGFTFSGWKDLPEIMPASDVTVNGSFTTNSYTLTYVVDGEVYKTFQFGFGEKLTAEAAPEKEGYSFSGWEGLPETMPASDVTVTGKFTVNTYTLTYVVDGEVYKTVEIEFGSKITPEAAPEKEGFTFSGWKDLPEIMPASDVTVNGSFSTNSYTLTYMVDGEVYKTFQFGFGEKLTAEAAPEKEGYTFSGWEGLPETMPASDVTVNGTFTVNTYTLTYVVDGEVYKTVEIEFGSKITPEAAPVKEGFTFSGWKDLPEIMPASDVTVNGSFTTNSYTLTYMVDGEVYKTFQFGFGEKLTAEAAPEKEGYTFSGWEGLPETMPASDVTVIGKFTVNTYTLTYVVDGEVYKTVDIEFGTKITPEVAPVKEGFTFSGWKDLPEIMPASDVTVNGSFSTNSYTLTYVVDGEVYKTFQFGFGEKLTAEAAPEKEGYTFSGWEGLPETMPASDVTVTGKFTVNVYTLTYVVDGEVYKTVEIEFGSKITPEAAPEKEGFTFSGWKDLPEIMPASDVTVNGSFSTNSYTLTYMVDGEVYKTFQFGFGEKLTAEAAPEKEGYSFSGWEGLPETMPASDVTVTGKFTVNTYTLTYVVDGEVYKTVDIEYGTKITPEAAPVKEGFTFSGWKDLPEIMPASDVTVSGSFSTNSYTLTYVVDGEVYKTFQFGFGEKLTAEAAPEKEGYTFSGWEGLPETMPASDVTVTGKFTVNTYTLTYVVDGEVYKTVDIEFGSKITPEAAPEKEGFTFSGWKDLPEIMPASDVTVSGSFSTNSYTLTYMVDGEVYKTFQFGFGEKLTPEAAPEKEGYTFSGWDGLPETMPASDVTVTGKFTVNTYTLTYVVDGEVYKTVDIEFGTKITPEVAPVKEGFTFSGWKDLPEIMPASDVTVSGSFSTNSYTLTYMVDGEVYKTFQFGFGEKLTPEAAPEKEGYTFSGWEGLPETMPASDVTVNGSFTVNTYTLTYVVDGEVYKTVDIEFGTKITPEVAPVKEGFTFSGWKDLPEIMPASDVTVSGSFSTNSYTLTYMVDGEVYKTVEYSYGATVEAEAAPVKDGYTFSGWEGLPETMPASDVTVNGTFTVNTYTLTYVVDGEVYKTVEYAYGSNIEAEAAPEKEGHTFSGWDGLPETMPASDVTVDGHFVVNTYTLIYVVDGNIYKNVEIEFGSKITPEAAPVKEGYTFSGWEGLPETMPASDVTVNSVYTINTYILTYMVDDEVYVTTEVAFGAKITPEEAPEKEGYTFSGWDGLPDTMPASDVTVNAYYTANYYKLTAYIDGEVYFEAELLMGEAIEIPEPQFPSGKVFDGWIEEVPATMPAHDVEIHGTTSIFSTLTNIFVDENSLLTVYNLKGMLVLKDVTIREASQKLSKGIYIINGKKILIK